MKKYLIALGLLCCIVGCKKTTENKNNNQLNIQVTGISKYTNYTIQVINYTHSQLSFNIEGNSDTTINEEAYAGDQLNIFYNIDYIAPGTDGSLGDGNINFIYNGKSIRTIVNGEGTVNNYIPHP